MARRRLQNAAIQRELNILVDDGVLTEEERAQIALRYPPIKWDLRFLSLWFTLFGTLAAVIGGGILLEQYFSFFSKLVELFQLDAVPELGLAIVTAGMYTLAYRARQKPERHRASEMLFLLGSMALTGLTLLLGKRFSTGSGNWPALIGIDTAIFVALGYALKSRLVMVYACINAFVWLGGHTGYVSGWGMYYFGMTYPMRFAIAGLLCTAVGWAHGYTSLSWLKPYRGFSRVYLHFGLFVLNMSLWIMSLWGYSKGSWSAREGERFLFTVLWLALSGTLLLVGNLKNVGLLRAYGLTYLIINGYTIYFQFVVSHSLGLWFFHILLIGGSLIFASRLAEQHGLSLSWRNQNEDTEIAEDGEATEENAQVIP